MGNDLRGSGNDLTTMVDVKHQNTRWIYKPILQVEEAR